MSRKGRLFVSSLSSLGLTMASKTTVFYLAWILIALKGVTYGQLDCDTELTASPTPATLTSPNYPANYPSNVHCVIHIRAPGGSKIELSFDTFELEDSESCSKDSLVIDDGIDGGHRLLFHSCGTNWIWPRFPDLLVESTSHEVTIVFVSDSYGTAPGYSLTYRSVITNPNVLFLTEDTRFRFIYRRNGQNGYFEEFGMRELTGIDFDPISGYVFYGDKGAQNIARKNVFDTSDPEVIVSQQIVDPFGLRVDVLSRLLYWTDANLRTVTVTNLDGTQSATLVATGLSQPGAIVTEPYRGFIYYTDWGSTAKIERAEGDGSNRQVIVQGLNTPRSLAIDLTERVLYWIDSELDVLQSVSYDGSNLRTLYEYGDEDAFNLVLDSDAFIFTDPTHERIRFDDRDLADIGGGLSFNSGSMNYTGLTLRPLQDPGDPPDVCPTPACSGLCLPKPNSQYTCVTDEDFVECNEELIASSVPGIITSPGYPNNYPDNLNCVIHIRAPEDTVVELTFNAFDLQDSENCVYDSLVIDDGIDIGPRLLYHSCGENIIWPAYPDVLVTTGNEITIRFVTDHQISSTGFSITYRAVTPDPIILVVAEDDNLRYWYRHNSINQRIEPPEIVEPIAVDYDPISEYFYYTDRGSKTIGRVHRASTFSTQILYSDNIEYPFGMHIDVISRLLYWTDADLGTITVSDLDGTERTTIIETELDSPGSIVVEPYTGYIYFTDWGSSAKIERAEGDGSNRVILVDNEIASPKALAMDFTERALYWIDAILGTLQTVNYDGSNLRTLYNFYGIDVFSMVLDADAFIFTDAHPDYGSIDFIGRGLESGQRGLVFAGDRHYRGITLRPLNDDGSGNPGTCPRTQCAGLCLPKPNNQYTCTTDIPTVVCPADREAQFDSGQSPSVPVTWAEPSGVVISKTHNSGDVFAEGVTTVTYLFLEDGFVVTCSFTVTVTERDTTPPVFLNCPGPRVVWVRSGSTSAIVTWDAVRLQNPNDYIISTSLPSGSVFFLGTVTVRILATDAALNTAPCTFTVTVQVDNEPPTISGCPADISTSLDTPGTTQSVTWIEPIISDNYGVPTWLVKSKSPGSQFPVGETVVTYIAVDSFQNTASCDFTVTVIDSLVIICPDDIMATYEIGRATSAQVSWVAPLGRDGNPATDSTHSPGDFFSEGVTTVTYTFLDSYTSSVATCSFQVTVEGRDTLPPIFRNCPAPIIAWIAPGTTSKQITWERITLQDQNDRILSSSLEPGSEFYIGTETVFVLASDSSSNRAWCNFSVTIQVDDIPPVISQCPADITVSLTRPSGTGTIVDWAEPSLADNAGDAYWSERPAPGSRFQVGTTQVIYTATDTFNNMASCTFLVTVDADIPPTPPDDDDSIIFIVGGVGGVLFLVLIIVIIILALRCRPADRPISQSGGPNLVGMGGATCNPAFDGDPAYCSHLVYDQPHVAKRNVPIPPPEAYPNQWNNAQKNIQNNQQNGVQDIGDYMQIRGQNNLSPSKGINKPSTYKESRFEQF